MAAPRRAESEIAIPKKIRWLAAKSIRNWYYTDSKQKARQPAINGRKEKHPGTKAINPDTHEP